MHNGAHCKQNLSVSKKMFARRETARYRSCHMAKDTRIAFRASVELKERLQRASKQVKLGETALAEAAVEAAIDFIEKNGGIWFPLRVVPDPTSAPPGKGPAGGGQRTAGRTDARAASGGGPSTGSAPGSPHGVNEDAPSEITPALPARSKKSGPRPRSTRGGIARVVGSESKK